MRIRKLASGVIAVMMAVSMAACGADIEPKALENAPAAETTDNDAADETVADDEAATAESEDKSVDNLFGAGNFSYGLGEYYTYFEGGEGRLSVNKNQEMQIDISKVGKVPHGAQVYHDGFSLREGVVYEVSFDIYATCERGVDWRFQLNGGDYHAYAEGKVAVTTEPQHISVTFEMKEATDPAPRFCFNVGYVDEYRDAGIDPADIEAHSIMVDNLCLAIVDDSNAVGSAGDAELTHIRVNQVGYKPNDDKYAVFADLDDNDDEFEVIDDKDKAVYTGKIYEAEYNDATGEMSSVAYFTEVNKPGTYIIRTKKGEESFKFKIGNNIYDDIAKDALRMIYMHRCGEDMPIEYAGYFAHEVCHNDMATVYETGEKIDVSGGWHDAGDYGRYVVSGAKAAYDLMMAYEHNPKAFSDDTNIPESGNGVSDILDEVRYELEWMLKMQSKNGGVYHKVTCANFPGFVMPDQETDELIVCPVSVTATADFAAVMAKASVVFRDIDDDFADKCYRSAVKAFEYASDHKMSDGFKNPDGIATGEYPDKTCTDELFWAAAELYKVAGNEKYMIEMKSAYDGVVKAVKNGEMRYTDLGWEDVAGYGCMTALGDDTLRTVYNEFYNQIKTDYLSQVNVIVDMYEKSPYMVTRDKNFEWGSNMGIANDAIAALYAFRIDSKAQYLKASKGCINYLMGLNAVDYCFVTGVGSRFPEHPHHRPSMAAGTVMPGMLVGGVNSSLEDPYAANVLKFLPGFKCYADSDQSYSTNEVAIYWNSPLVYLLTY